MKYVNTFPTSYKLQPSSGAKLCFLQHILPNASTCCQPNFTEILIRLQSVIPTTINLTFSPGAFGYDENQPNEAVVIGMSSGNLYWSDPSSLTFLKYRFI
jgi:hypothetical protein